MDSIIKNMTEMIQQSAMSIAKQTSKQKKPKISLPTRALMKKRREMIENNTPRYCSDTPVLYSRTIGYAYSNEESVVGVT